MTSHRYTSSRPPRDVAGYAKSGLSWSEINGPLSPRRRAVGKLLAAGVGIFCTCMALGILSAMIP